MKISLKIDLFNKVLGVFISLIGFLCVTGWLIDLNILTSWGSNIIPMSPDTALIFTLLGVIVATKSYKSSKAPVKKSTMLLLLLLSVYVLLKSTGVLLNIDLTFENYLFPKNEKWGAYPLKIMSPITGFLFLISGLSFLIKMKVEEKSSSNNLIGILGSFISFIGFTVILGYLFQTPLLYGSKIIPVALTSGICFLLLGVSIVLMGGENNLIARQFLGQTPYNTLTRSITPFLLLVILFQGLILKFFSNSDSVNIALISAVLSMLFILATSIVIIRVSKKVFQNTIVAENKNEQAEWAIKERVKEIQCIQHITKITDKENFTPGKFFNRVVSIIPQGFQYPEKTECRIVLKDQIFQTSSFVATKNSLKAEIVSKNKAIGFIDVCLLAGDFNSLTNGFLKEKKDLLLTISKILGEFVERKRKEQVQKIIYNSSIAVDTSESLTDLVDYIKKQIGLLIDTTNFFAAFYDEETDSISLPYHKDQKDIIAKFPAGKTLTKHVIKSQKPLLVTKREIEKLEKEGIIELFGNKAEVWLGVPLTVKGKITGIFAVQSYVDENAYNLDDLEMFEFISRQVSISLERKKVEQDLKAAYLKAKESDRLKSTFLATMSHELRTPLNAVIGFSEMMQGEIESNKIPEYAGIINNSGIHLLEIIEDIFDITLLESGEVRVSKSEFVFKTLLDDIRVMIYVEKEKMEKQSISIKYNPTIEIEELTLNTDKSKLKQILVNLLKNALKFTLEGFIEYGFVVEIESGNQVIKFYVKDTGIGIREEDKEIIFDNFRQVDDTNTRLFGGTGIGLSVAKRYSEMLGGKIWVESIYGVGSTFYFTIPHPIPSATPKSPKIVIDPSAPPKFTGKTILIAEDEISNYELLIIYLEELDVNTLWAKDGEEAVSICESNSNIDLILMDIKMPKMNGLDATTIIKRKRPNLPIIAQTAFVLHGDDEKAFEAGCNDYIGKPIKRRDLYTLLAKFLSA